MNILELVLGGLIQEKNILEAELERVINDNNLTTLERVDRSKKLLVTITETFNNINTVTGYLPVKKSNDEVITNNDK
jgi:hypothetical protein